MRQETDARARIYTAGPEGPLANAPFPESLRASRTQPRVGLAAYRRHPVPWFWRCIPRYRTDVAGPAPGRRTCSRCLPLTSLRTAPAQFAENFLTAVEFGALGFCLRGGALQFSLQFAIRQRLFLFVRLKQAKCLPHNLTGGLISPTLYPAGNKFLQLRRQ